MELGAHTLASLPDLLDAAEQRREIAGSIDLTGTTGPASARARLSTASLDARTVDAASRGRIDYCVVTTTARQRRRRAAFRLRRRGMRGGTPGAGRPIRATRPGRDGGDFVVCATGAPRVRQTRCWA
jgi:hypothetical protein